MTSLLARLTPTAWRRPRPTARLRLTLLYGALFLLSGAVLLTVTYLLFAQTTGIIKLPDGEQIIFGNPSASTAAHSAPTAYNDVAYPVQMRPGQIPPALAHSQEAQQLQAQAVRLHAFEMHELLLRSGTALGITAIISIALGWLIAGRVLRPVRTISTTARRIGASNLHERVSLDGPDDEFRELAVTLDDLLARLQASFDSQRRFVANASHELRTPLTLDRALLERALRQREPTQAFWRTTCERLLVSSRQQDHMIEALLTLARSERGVASYESFELSTVIDNVLLSPELDTGPPGIRIHTAIDRAAVDGDPRLVERMVRNLIDNAIRYNQPAGRVDIAVTPRSGRAILVVSNTGPPISTTELDRLFRPFQRLAHHRSGRPDGSGLGLSIVKAIADAHDASITAIPQEQGGLRIEVSFPPPQTGRDTLAAPALPGAAAGYEEARCS